MSEAPETLTYERALELLDQKLRSLEDGKLSLDDALAAVDEARVYLKVCQQKLDEAKRRIEVRPDSTTTPAAEAAPLLREDRDPREDPERPDTLL